MNILVFSWRDPKHPLAGGAEQVMHEHMKGWIEAGSKVTLFSSYFKGAKPEENLDGITIIRRGYELLGVQIAAFIWYVFRSNEKYDLIVDQFHGIPFFTPFFVRTRKLAVVQEVANKVWLYNRLPKPFNWIVGIIGYYGEPLIYLFYKKVPFMTGSNSAKDQLIKVKIQKKNIFIVPHGIKIKKLPKLPPKEKNPTIIFLGALAKDKGIEDALVAFSKLKSKNVNFWVVGKANTRRYFDHLENLAKKLDIENKTKFWGFVNEKVKFKLLAKSHLLINPSIVEGWGLVNIEANAVGTPVVAYNSPGLVDSVQNNKSGVICINNTPEELAIAATELIENEEKYRKLQASSISWSKNFSWEKSKALSLNLINDIVVR